MLCGTLGGKGKRKNGSQSSKPASTSADREEQDESPRVVPQNRASTSQLSQTQAQAPGEHANGRSMEPSGALEQQQWRDICSASLTEAAQALASMESALARERARRLQSEADVKVLLAAIHAERGLLTDMSLQWAAQEADVVSRN